MRVTTLLLATGVLACGSLLPRSAHPDLFLLTAVTPAPGAACADAPWVLVGPVTLPDYLDRRELVTQLAPNQLRVEDLELWAEPLRDALPRVLADDLTTVLGPGSVQRLPWTGGAAPDALVAVEIARFEKTAGGTVELAARWTITGARATPGRHETRLSLRFAPAGTRAAVAAMSEELAALSRAIAASVVGAMHPASATFGDQSTDYAPTPPPRWHHGSPRAH